MAKAPEKDDEPKVTPEGQRKGDDIIRRMVNTTPKPHKPTKKGRAHRPRRSAPTE